MGQDPNTSIIYLTSLCTYIKSGSKLDLVIEPQIWNHGHKPRGPCSEPNLNLNQDISNPCPTLSPSVIQKVTMRINS